MWHLIFGLALLALAVWAVANPPHSFFWMISLLPKEWGWVGALLCLPLLLWLPAVRTWATWTGFLTALVALVLFLVPLVEGASTARRLAPSPFGDLPAEPGDRPAPFRWRDLLLGVRAPRRPPETVTYDTLPDGRALRLDIYRPARPGPAPVVLVIHGGSWRGGDRKQLPALNHYLAHRGYFVAAMEYRLAPAHKFPAAREDVRSAIRHIKESGAVLGADPNRIVLLGRSAGAHLALVAAYGTPDPAIRGVISYYGPFSLAWGWHQACKVLDVHTVIGDFLGGSPEDYPEVYREAEPVQLVRPGVPPTLLIQGAHDTMVAPTHCDHLMEKLDAVGAKYEYVLVPRATHASDINFAGPFGQISTYVVERFLRNVMR